MSLKTEEAEHIRCWVTFIDPEHPDTNPPFRIRADRWSLVRFGNRIPFTAKNLAKLAPAADPWSTAIAVYHEKGDLFIWGLVDQTVHASTSLVRESPPRYSQPGLFYAVIDGTAELSVYREDGLIARLRQDTVIPREHDALWRGPVYKKLLPAIRKLRRHVVETVGKKVYDESYSRRAALKRSGSERSADF